MMMKRVGTGKDEDDENRSEKEKKEKVRSRRKIRMEGKKQATRSPSSSHLFFPKLREERSLNMKEKEVVTEAE